MYGIVFEGGGAKGSYQIGVCNALKDLNITISGAVGTSIGSLTAALLVQGDVNLSTTFWEKIAENRSTLPPEENALYEKIFAYEFKSKDPFHMKKEMQEVFNCDGMELSFFRDALKAVINEEEIRKARKDLGLVTISLTKKMGLELFLEDIPSGQLLDFIIASCYFPTFKSIKLNGDYYMDGIYFNRLPSNMLIDKGYKNIIEVVLYPSRNKQRDYTVPSDVNIITIEPSTYLGKTLGFDKEQFLFNMELGYKDTLKIFSQL